MTDPLRGLPDVAPAGMVGASPMQAGAGARAAADAMSAIARSAQSLANMRQPVEDARRRRDAEEDAAADAQSETGFRETPLRTRADAVYAQAYQAAAMSHWQAQVDDEIRDLASAHQMDAEGFQLAFEERMAALGERMTVNPTMSLYARSRAAAVRDQIDGVQEQAEISEAQQSLELRLANIQRELQSGIVDDAGFAATEAGQALIEQAQSIVDILVENPLFGWSEEQGLTQIEGLANASEEALFMRQIELAYDADGRVGALEAIDTLVGQVTATNDERLALRSRLTGVLNNLDTMTAARRAVLQEEERNRRREAEQEASAFAADLQARVTLGDSFQPSEVQRLTALRSLDLIDQGVFSTIINGVERRNNPAGADDEVVDFALLQTARDLTVADDVFMDALSTAVAAGQLTGTRAQSILDEREQYRDGRIGPATQLLRGYFERSIFDFAGGVAAAEQEAMVDLREWADQNPEATRSQILGQARLIAQEYGRQAPEPPLPVFVSRPDVSASVSEWRASSIAAARRQYGLEDSGAMARASDQQLAALQSEVQRIEAYAAWLEAQRVAAPGGQ